MSHPTDGGHFPSRRDVVKRWLRLALQLLSLALFGLILWSGGVETWQEVLTGDRGDILVAFLLGGVANTLSATRLRLVAHSVAGRELASWRRFYYLNMTARALGLVMPRGLSTVGGKSVALRALGVSFRRAVWIVMLDNLFDLMLLGVLAVPGLLFLNGKVSSGGFIALAFGLILALAGGLWWATAIGQRLPLAGWLGRVPWLASVLHLDPESAAVDLLPTRSIAMRALGLSFLLNGILAIRFYYIACAVEVVYPWLIFVAGFPITQLSLVLAVTPGALGLFDASWYGVLLLGGVLPEEALTFIIAQRAYIFVFVLVWAGFSTLLSLTTEK
jgi:uncharacterized membrane protein YbhN (UPF0104 family)